MTAATTEILAGRNLRQRVGPMAIVEAAADWPRTPLTPGELPGVLVSGAPNLGLLYQRYLPGHDAPRRDGYAATTSCLVSWNSLWNKVQSLGVDRQKRAAERAVNEGVQQWAASGFLDWFCRMEEGQYQMRDAYERLAKRRLAAIGADRQMVLTTRSRLAIGLGNPAVKENAGLAWQHTYGAPVLPGTSLKGVLRHFLAEEGACLDPETRVNDLSDLTPGLADGLSRAGVATARHLSDLLFGAAGEHGSTGAVCFHDALPVWPKEGWLEREVLTPHHLHQNGLQALETDDPTPIPYLVVREGVAFTLPIGLTRRGRALPTATATALLDAVEALLAPALGHWGIGAKTGAGYGRLAPPVSAASSKVGGTNADHTIEVTRLVEAAAAGGTQFMNAVREAVKRSVPVLELWAAIAAGMKERAMSPRELLRRQIELRRAVKGDSCPPGS